MNSLIRFAARGGVLAVLLPVAVCAETRGKPFTEEELLQKSSAVFVGEVLEITEVDRYKRVVPSRARVVLSIKGKVHQDEREVQPKDPGSSSTSTKSSARRPRAGWVFSTLAPPSNRIS